MPIENLPANLKRLRQERELTQQQLADAIEMSQSNYARIERGGRHDPQGSTLERLAIALGVPIDELLR